jgi:Domain of unknown function (DUF5666)
MKHRTQNTIPESISRRDALAFTLLVSTLSLAGCGGGGGGDSGAVGGVGGGVAGVSSGGTGSFSTGSISGFGSIIVAGVRYDDSTASTIRDIDDNTDLRGQLKLGMVVRIKAQLKSSDGLRANADSIEVSSNLLGPIDSINSVATELVVLGKTVRISPATIFEDGLGGLASLKVGDIVELYGFSDPASNAITATRVEKKSIATARIFKLQGAVRNLNNAARTFAIGTQTIGFNSADLSGLALRDALVVRVQLNSTLNAGVRSASRIRADELELRDIEEAEVEGTVTSFTSSTQFSVNGVPVNASAALVPAGVAPGALVEVEGRLVGGVLIARKVEIEDERDPLKFELHGTISALNTTARTFVLRGITVNFSGAVRLRDGIAPDLSNVGNRAIEVKGLLSPNGTQVSATEIRFEN